MNEVVDGLLDCICHRGGAHADLLPLCLRCSSVYAGVLIGAVFELLVRGARRRGVSTGALVLNALGLAAMGVVGFGALYGCLTAPAVFEVFTALWFGSAVAFFAVSAISHELAGRERRRAAPVLLRVFLLAALASWAWAAATGHTGALRVLGMTAAAGLIAAFGLVNLAFALVLLRRLRGRASRLAVSGFVVPVVAAIEFVLFSLWRRL